MSEINLPPFYVGQKVVALKNQINGDFKSGDIFIVKETSRCQNCKAWTIDVGISYPQKHFAYIAYCWCGANKGRTENPNTFYSTKLFAPVHENFQSISLEKVLEEETKLISVN